LCSCQTQTRSRHFFVETRKPQIGARPHRNVDGHVQGTGWFAQARRGKVFAQSQRLTWWNADNVLQFDESGLQVALGERTARAKAVHFDWVVYSPVPDSTIRLANLQAGALDVIERLDPTLVARLVAIAKG